MFEAFPMVPTLMGIRSSECSDIDSEFWCQFASVKEPHWWLWLQYLPTRVSGGLASGLGPGGFGWSGIFFPLNLFSNVNKKNYWETWILC